jgi:hypothetical protein
MGAIKTPTLPTEIVEVETAYGAVRIPAFVPPEGHVCEPENACRHGDFCRQMHRESGGCGHMHNEGWPDCSARPKCWACGRFLRVNRWGQAMPHVADGPDGWEATC